jgi:peptidoglycan/LPS O-acetylase OafA/YrhL
VARLLGPLGPFRLKSEPSLLSRPVCDRAARRGIKRTGVKVKYGARNDMSSPMASDSRYRSIDVWRGLVCLLVVLEHTGVALWRGMTEGHGLEGGLRQAIVTPLQWNLGAPLFFVMSGYCVATSLESLRRRGSSALSFLARRFWRIFPPYWASLAVFVVVVLALDALGLDRLHRSPYALELDSPGALNVFQWWGNLTLTETWRPLVWRGAPNVFTRVGWSLCYQEQFYLLAVLLLVLVPRRLFRAFGIATAIVLCVRVTAFDLGMLHRIEGTFVDLWHEFAIGLAVYWRLNVAKTRLQKLSIEVGLLILLAIAATSNVTSTVGASAFGLILIAFRRWDDPVARVKSFEPIRALGRRSYSIYLVHLPAAMVVTASLGELGVTEFWDRALFVVPLSTVAAIAAGWVFHNAVDRHFHQLPKVRAAASGSATVIERPTRIGVQPV